MSLSFASSRRPVHQLSESPAAASFGHVLEEIRLDLDLIPVQSETNSGFPGRSSSNVNATRQVPIFTDSTPVSDNDGPSRAPDSEASTDTNVCPAVHNQSLCGSDVSASDAIFLLSQRVFLSGNATQTALNHDHVNKRQAISSDVSQCVSKCNKRKLDNLGDEPAGFTSHSDAPGLTNVEPIQRLLRSTSTSNRTDQTELPVPAAITFGGDMSSSISPHDEGRTVTESIHPTSQDHGNIVPNNGDACSFPEPLHPPIASISEPPTTTTRKRRVMARDYTQAPDPTDSEKRVLPSKTLYYKNDAGKFVCRYVGPACVGGCSQVNADLRSLIRHLRVHARKEVHSGATEDQWVACNGMPDEILRPMVVCAVPEEELHTCRHFREHGKRWMVRSMKRWEDVIARHKREDHDDVDVPKAKRRKCEGN